MLFPRERPIPKKLGILGSGTGASTRRRYQIPENLVVLGTPEQNVEVGRIPNPDEIVNDPDTIREIASQLWNAELTRRNISQRFRTNPIYVNGYINFMMDIQRHPRSYNQISSTVRNALQELINQIVIQPQR